MLIVVLLWAPRPPASIIARRVETVLVMRVWIENVDVVCLQECAHITQKYSLQEAGVNLSYSSENVASTPDSLARDLDCVNHQRECLACVVYGEKEWSRVYTCTDINVLDILLCVCASLPPQGICCDGWGGHEKRTRTHSTHMHARTRPAAG